MKILLFNPAKPMQMMLENHLHFPKYSITTFNGKSGYEKTIRIFHPDLFIFFEIKDNTSLIIKSIEFIRSKKAFDNSQIIVLSEILDDENLINLYDKGVDYVVSNKLSHLVIIKYIQNIHAKQISIKNSNQNFITLNSNDYSVKIGETTSYLAKREFELLQLLITPPNKIYSRNDIIQHIWSDMQLKNDRTIDVHITRIRQKLNIENIVTVKRKGFKFLI